MVLSKLAITKNPVSNTFKLRESYFKDNIAFCLVRFFYLTKNETALVSFFFSYFLFWV